MPRIVRVFGFLLLALSALQLRAQDPKFYIFVCFGQSNMEGYPGIPESEKQFNDSRFQMLAAVDFPEMKREKGHWYTAVPPLSRPPAGLSPTDYFGRNLIQHLPKDVRIGVVNVAVGGCKIELFDQTQSEAYIATAPVWMKGPIEAYGGSPYGRLVEMARLAQKDGVIKGILLHQGESNTGDKEWPNKVKRVYESLLNDLGLKAADVPLLAGGVVPADQEGKCASMNAIIAKLPETIPTAHFVPSDHCAALSDHLHFTPEGYQELGKRYADTMLPLLQ